MRGEDGVAAGGAPPRPARRAVLGGMLATGVGLVTGACGGDREREPANPSPTPTPDPDAALVLAVVEDKRSLLARYDVTGSRFPNLLGRLAPLRADHVAHLAALDAPPEAPADPAATPSPGGTPDRPVPLVPAERRAAARALAKAEQAAAGRRVPQCVAARDPELARLLAAIGGCEAAHGAVLDRLAADLPAESRPKATEKPR